MGIMFKGHHHWSARMDRMSGLAVEGADGLEDEGMSLT